MTEPSQDRMDQEIQRLIDRELNDDQRMQLLQRIDTEAPEAWRTIALGYLEADLIRSVFEEEREEVNPDVVVPISASAPDRSRWRTVAVAAAAVILGIFVGVGVPLPDFSSSEEVPPLAEGQESGTSEEVPPSFQAIESLDLALRDRGLEPVVSKAFYRAELPDGRRLVLPIQTLSFQPE